MRRGKNAIVGRWRDAAWHRDVAALLAAALWLFSVLTTAAAAHRLADPEYCGAPLSGDQLPGDVAPVAKDLCPICVLGGAPLPPPHPPPIPTPSTIPDHSVVRPGPARVAAAAHFAAHRPRGPPAP